MKPVQSLFQKNSAQPRGQSIVLVAVALVGIIAFVGLAVDVGLLFIGYGHLRRAADAAAIAAATQYREGWELSDLTNTANEFLALNGVQDGSFQVEVCATNPGDPELCTNPPRKLIRVVGKSRVQTAFLPVIGIYSININAEAIGEAASMDVVLVLDISESMTWDAACGDGDDDDGDGVIDDGPTDYDEWRPWRMCNGINPADPNPDFTPRNAIICNNTDTGGSDGIPGECHPFEEVKSAAADFAKWVLDNKYGPANEEDRLGIVVFSNGWQGVMDESTGGPMATPQLTGTMVVGGGWFTDQTQAVNAILGLNVYQAPQCSTTSYWEIQSPGTCNWIQDDGTYGGTVCPLWDASNPLTAPIGGDDSTCGTTAIGLGLNIAGSMFALQSHPAALWVTILLTDGAANATELKNNDQDLNTLPWGFCPQPYNVWSDWDFTLGNAPFCQDASTNTSHPKGSQWYDADDYARDAARFVACDPTSPAAGCNGVKGQGSLMFAIGLGTEVLKPGQYNAGTGSYDPVDIDHDGYDDQYGDALLRFISEIGDDGDPYSAYQPCSYDNTPRQRLTPGNDQYSCGNYYYREFGGDLGQVFSDISSRIFTRLSH